MKDIKQFYLKTPDKIIDSLEFIENKKIVNIYGIDLYLLNNVYPSQCFRTTNFLLEAISKKVKNKSICDMGCSLGIIGQFSLKNKAKRVVQADININAVKNAKVNKKFYKYSNKILSIYHSNCFDKIPQEIFDIIIFNLPFHSDKHFYVNEMEYAFYDSEFVTAEKFLSQCKTFAHHNSEIIIAFSNKGDINTLEKLFEKYNFQWKLWKRINGTTKYDNRLYLLKLK